MTQEELDKIVEQHQHWIKQDCEGWEGMRANLSSADLSKADLNGTNLRGVDLSEAYLYGANLSWANLSEADLSKADLYGANLNGANLHRAFLYGANLYGTDLSKADLSEADLRKAGLIGANLSSADLSEADLIGANLSSADLSDANLSRANLNGVDLNGANLSEAERFRLGMVVDEPLMGYKKTKEGVVITAEIPAGAIVFCINGSKCRTNRAKITDMAGHEVLHSQYDNTFEYRLGQEINIKDFNLMYNVECASGFHFFRTRKEAEKYR